VTINVSLIDNSNRIVRTYIQQQFEYLLKNKPIIYALSGILRDDENETRVFRLFENISLLKNV
jgi:hypothetical protein